MGIGIDLLPTIAELTGAELPTKYIDGKSAWTLFQGTTNKSPQEAYYFYYHRNELHGIRWEKWKLYFPHRYRTLNGRPGGDNGLPANYDYVRFEEMHLFCSAKG